MIVFFFFPSFFLSFFLSFLLSFFPSFFLSFFLSFLLSFYEYHSSPILFSLPFHSGLRQNTLFSLPTQYLRTCVRACVNFLLLLIAYCFFVSGFSFGFWFFSFFFSLGARDTGNPDNGLFLYTCLRIIHGHINV